MLFDVEWKMAGIMFNVARVPSNGRKKNTIPSINLGHLSFLFGTILAQTHHNNIIYLTVYMLRTVTLNILQLLPNQKGTHFKIL